LGDALQKILGNVFLSFFFFFSDSNRLVSRRPQSRERKTLFHTLVKRKLVSPNSQSRIATIWMRPQTVLLRGKRWYRHITVWGYLGYSEKGELFIVDVWYSFSVDKQGCFLDDV